jgi:hypothetical protein
MRPKQRGSGYQQRSAAIKEAQPVAGKQGRKQEAAIAALLTEPTHAAAASKAGVSEPTLQRWLRDPGFSRAYRAARSAVFEVAIGKLQRIAASAADRLEANLTCGKPAAEIAAARAILEHARDGIELYDVVERLAALEERAEKADEAEKAGKQ